MLINLYGEQYLPYWGRDIDDDPINEPSISIWTRQGNGRGKDGWGCIIRGIGSLEQANFLRQFIKLPDNLVHIDVPNMKMERDMSSVLKQLEDKLDEVIAVLMKPSDDVIPESNKNLMKGKAAGLADAIGILVDDDGDTIRSRAMERYREKN